MTYQITKFMGWINVYFSVFRNSTLWNIINVEEITMNITYERFNMFPKLWNYNNGTYKTSDYLLNHSHLFEIKINMLLGLCRKYLLFISKRKLLLANPRIRKLLFSMYCIQGVVPLQKYKQWFFCFNHCNHRKIMAILPTSQLPLIRKLAS